ncbi:MAG: NAD(P)H-dependent oxidoreductase, partial [Pseudomonadota bacterium]
MTDQLKKITDAQCKTPPARYDDLSVLMLNCTLTRSPNLSHTEGLLRIAEQIYQANGVKTEILRPVDYEIPAGLGLDYAGVDNYLRDDWPFIQTKIDACDILIIGTSVWLGEKSSVCNRVLERMYGYTHHFNEKGQYRDYGKTGGVLITGNEDGVKHCAMN